MLAINVSVTNLTVARLEQRKPAGISFTQRPILRFFAPQGRHVAPMGMKFGTEDGT